MARWLRFIALIIFVFVTAYAIPFAWNSPSFGNVALTLIFAAITIWVAVGFFSKQAKNPSR